jgi:hypothetical protein
MSVSPTQRSASGTARQSTGASQSAQTNPTQIVEPSAATGVESNVGVTGSNNNARIGASATTNQSTSASQNTGVAQGLNVAPTQQAQENRAKRDERRAERERERNRHRAERNRGRMSQNTGASQSAQTNPEQHVNPSAATGVESSARIRGDNNRLRQGASATTNQSTTASQNTGVTQGMNVSPGQGAGASVPGMGAVPGGNR